MISKSRKHEINSITLGSYDCGGNLKPGCIVVELEAVAIVAAAPSVEI